MVYCSQWFVTVVAVYRMLIGSEDPRAEMPVSPDLQARCACYAPWAACMSALSVGVPEGFWGHILG